MKRYYTTAFDGRTFEHQDGPFVLYADYEALAAITRTWLENFGSTDVLSIETRKILAPAQEPK